MFLINFLTVCLFFFIELFNGRTGPSYLDSYLDYLDFRERGSLL